MKLHRYFRSSSSFRVRVALAQPMACETGPINNLRVLSPVVAGFTDLKEVTRARFAWFQRRAHAWRMPFERQPDVSKRRRVADGSDPSACCCGNTPTLAGCCLVPQIINGRRLELSRPGLPRTPAVFDARMKLSALPASQPSACSDLEA